MTPSTPLRIGRDDDRGVVRRALERVGFTEQAIAARGDLPALHGAGGPAFAARLRELSARDPQLEAVRLFLAGEAVPWSRAAAIWTAAELAAFEAVDLLRSGGDDAEGTPMAACPVVLAPLGGPTGDDDLLVAADRQVDGDGATTAVADDVVFTAHNPLTRQFVGLLPRRQDGDVLDLCTGGGVAALTLSRTARRVVASDLTGRSAHFARFNAWLNGASDVEVTTGDLYQAVGDREFDFICAHPPYVPTLHDVAIYRDGGPLGDSVVRGVVAGVPDHLRPGGDFFLLGLGMDTASEPFEARVRAWLGPRGAEFDLVYAVDHSKTPEEFAHYVVERTSAPGGDELERWLALLAAHDIRAVVYGAIVGRRLAAGVTGTSRRVKLSSASNFAAFGWQLRWLARQRDVAARGQLLGQRVRLASGTTLDVRHRVEEGWFQPVECRLANGGWPFPAVLEVAPWIAALAESAARAATVGDAVSERRAAGTLPDGMSDADAVDVIERLVERGVLVLEGWPHG